MTSENCGGFFVLHDIWHENHFETLRRGLRKFYTNKSESRNGNKFTHSQNQISQTVISRESYKIFYIV